MSAAGLSAPARALRRDEHAALHPQATRGLNDRAPEHFAVCYFGSYEPKYTRVRMVQKGLRDVGVEVFECNSAYRSRLLRFPILAYRFLRLARRVDLILVNEAGQAHTPLAKLLGLLTRKPVVLDAYLSKYLVYVTEKRSGGVRARMHFLLDAVACRLADRVLLDTPEHVEYFARTFGVPAEKFASIPIGADDEWFRPAAPAPAGRPFRVVYVGTFYKVHGVEHILRAADLLREETDIHFDLYGNGPLRDELSAHALQRNLSNVTFHGWVAPEKIPSLMAEADVCLGMFGRTTHADLVVPCKVYEALAMARPVLTGDTPAMRRFLVDGEDALLCPTGDPAGIARGVRALRDDPALRERIAQSGQRRFAQEASRAAVGARVRDVLQDLLARRRGAGRG